MIHKLQTPPASEPITLAQMRGYLGINDATTTDRDTVIAARIASARQVAENYTRRALITQTWRGFANEFDDVIALIGPLQSVTSIKYIDSNSVLQTLAPSAYDVSIEESCIVPAYGLAWPTTNGTTGAVEVEYVCGYGGQGATPAPIIDAMVLIVTQAERYLLSMAGDYSDVVRPMTMPNACKQLMDPYTDYRNISRSQ